MLAKVFTAQTVGLTPHIINVEVDAARGLHSYAIVGLPDRVIEESKERVNAAIKNSGFKAPVRGNRRIVVSLAPAHVKKEGPLFDVAIALGNLLALGEISFNVDKKLFLGELALSGELRPIQGTVLLVKKAKEVGFTDVFLPKQNAKEAALIDSVHIYGVNTLSELVKHLNEKGEDTVPYKIPIQEKTVLTKTLVKNYPDYKDIVGQDFAKRGLEIAAAGGHNIAMVGPPGAGKTLLAKAFAGILPDLCFEDILTVTGIHSQAGLLGEHGIVTEPPCIAPHHTASYVALVGGGAWPKPGQITLAHKGVLFLDEFPEFDRRVIESLRQPLEDRVINISRAKDSVQFPADLILIAAMNQCPCGKSGIINKECVCTASAIIRYKRKISGPIADRIDLWTYVPEVPLEKLASRSTSESSYKIKERVRIGREVQHAIFKKAGVRLQNIGQAQAKDIKKIICLPSNVEKMFNESAEKLGLSARGYHKVLKVAQTIAALSGTHNIKTPDILEALQYRPKDFWE